MYSRNDRGEIRNYYESYGENQKSEKERKITQTKKERKSVCKRER